MFKAFGIVSAVLTVAIITGALTDGVLRDIALGVIVCAAIVWEILFITIAERWIRFATDTSMRWMKFALTECDLWIRMKWNNFMCILGQ